jgi:hypothetical protein
MNSCILHVLLNVLRAASSFALGQKALLTFQPEALVQISNLAKLLRWAVRQAPPATVRLLVPERNRAKS